MANSKDGKKPDILHKIETKLREATKFRKQFENQWEENKKFYNGDQWLGLSDRRPIKNYIFSIIEGEVPILTDSRPGTSIIPIDPDETNQDIAKQLETGIQSVYDRQRFSLKIVDAVRNSLIASCGWVYIGYDPDADHGDGNIFIKILPWKQVYIDPSAGEIDEANYAIIRIPMDIEEIKRRFPDKAKEIKPIKYSTGEDSSDLGSSLPEDRHLLGSGSSEDDVSRFESASMGILQEAWLKDYTMVKIPEEETLKEIEKEAGQLSQGIAPDIGKYENHEMHWEAHEQLKYQLAAQMLQTTPDEINPDIIEQLKEDPEIGVLFIIIDDHQEAHKIMFEQNPKAMRPKYPDAWRLVITSGAENVILFDGPPDVEDGKIPLAQVFCYKDLENIYGKNEIENIISMQKSINDMDYAEYKSLRLNANSGWIIDENSGVDEDSLTNDEGIVVTKNQGTEVTRLEPGVVSPQYQSRKINDKDAMREISGVTEVSQGLTPTGVTAARAIRTIKEQSIGRIRLKTRYLEEYTMPRIGELIASRIVRYWTTEKKLRIYDKSGQLNYIEYKPELVQNLEYEVKAVPGTTAGLDKESILILLERMVDTGKIQPSTFFKVTDVPYKQQILEDLAESDEKDGLIAELAGQIEQLTGVPADQVIQPQQ